MNSKKILYVILAITLLLFNLCAFVIPTPLTSSFLVAYIFTTISIVIQILIFSNSDINEKIMKKSFFGYSIIYIDVLYGIFQIIIFILTKLCSQIPLWLTIILNVVLLSGFVIILCSTYLSIDYINSIENKNREKVNFLKTILIDIELLEKNEENKEIRNELLKLIEKIRYSDPISNGRLLELEEKITIKVKELIDNKDKKIIIKELNNLFDERNKKCQLYKGEM